LILEDEKINCCILKYKISKFNEVGKFMSSHIFTFIFLAVLFFIVSENVVLAQDCPTVTVTTSSETVQPGETIKFTANVSSGNSTPTYNWVVSAGEISSGQGTLTIEIVTTNDMSGTTITASVELGNLDSNCSVNSASATIEIAQLKANAVGEFTRPNSDSAKNRLDDLIVQAQNDPAATVAIVAYSAEKGSSPDVNEAEKQLSFAYSYLVRLKGFDPNRITVINAGTAEVAKTQLYIIPAGATLEDFPGTILRPSLKISVVKKVGSQLNPVADANITVKLNEVEIKTGKTDADGIAIITLDVQGNYKVTACLGAICSDEKSRKVDANARFGIDLRMP
jgi:hypothetical protein